MDTIYLTSATDQGLAAGLGIALTSVLERTTGPIELHLVLEGVSDEDRARYMELGRRFSVPVRLVEANFGDGYRGADTNDYIPLTSYYRLNMGEYLPPEAKRAIYIDGDMLCLGDLRQLYDESLGGHIIGAVHDPVVDEVSGDGIEREHVGHGPNDRYFNSGTLLVDVERWRSERVLERLQEQIRATPKRGRFHDQSHLNVFFGQDWQPLALRYNLQARMFGIQMEPLPYVDRDELARALNSPVLVHFNGPCKPWYDRILSPFTKEFRQVWKRSPWADWRPEQNLAHEWRWKFGDFRKNWRNFFWCRNQAHR